MNYPVDRDNGGFYGAVTNDLQILVDVPRSAILCARILWTFSAAYRTLGDEAYLATAKHAYDYLTTVFWDEAYGGLYWSVDRNGRPVEDRKHHYAQAFGIYGLTEYYRATQDPQSLQFAKNLFHLLEEYAYDPVHGGYVEGSSRSWGTLQDMRLSSKELNSSKSMNTMLHILEAYTNLLRVWDDEKLKVQHRDTIEAFLQHIINSQTNHFSLLFDDEWHSMSPTISFGHDIEGSWLLYEAAEGQGDPELLCVVREVVVKMATAVHTKALDPDGSLLYEVGPHGLEDDGKAWWAQAEGMVGFTNAYQLTHDEQFAQATVRLWQYIQDKMIDRAHGDWYKQLHRDGTPDLEHYKAGPWDCPYHHGRACLEMMARIN
jgi:mannobiose 2-epimerase